MHTFAATSEHLPCPPQRTARHVLVVVLVGCVHASGCRKRVVWCVAVGACVCGIASVRRVWCGVSVGPVARWQAIWVNVV